MILSLSWQQRNLSEGVDVAKNSRDAPARSRVQFDELLEIPSLRRRRGVAA